MKENVLNNDDSNVVCLQVSAASLHCRPSLKGTHSGGTAITTCEWRRFSVDPQITTFDVLQNLLVKAFDIKG